MLAFYIPSISTLSYDNKNTVIKIHTERSSVLLFLSTFVSSSKTDRNTNTMKKHYSLLAF